MEGDNENSVISGSWWGLRIFHCSDWHQLFASACFSLLLGGLGWSNTHVNSSSAASPGTRARLVNDMGSCKSHILAATLLCYLCYDLAAIRYILHLVLYYFRAPSIQLLLKSLVKWQHFWLSSQYWPQEMAALSELFKNTSPTLAGVVQLVGVLSRKVTDLIPRFHPQPEYKWEAIER